MNGGKRTIGVVGSALLFFATGWGQSMSVSRSARMETGSVKMSALPPYAPDAAAEGEDPDAAPSHGSSPEFPAPARQSPAKQLQPGTSSTANVASSPASAFAPASSFNSLNSPSPAVTFQAQPMQGNYPPDTTGAVNSNFAMSASTDQIVIQDRLGHQLSSTNLTSFWSGTFSGITPAWDPNVRYDPYANRWIFVCMGAYSYSGSSMLIAVSATSDPTGTWYLRRVLTDSPTTTFDHPRVGFNQNWIVVTGNQVKDASPNAWVYSVVYVYDKADFYANGTKLPVEFSNITSDFTLTPALTYDPTVSTMYLMANNNGNSSGTGTLSLSTITGPVDSPVLSLNVKFPSTTNTWASSVPQNFAPQLGSSTNIGVFDARMNTVVYRNGSLWATHTVFVPASSPTISAVDWWQVRTDGTVQQFGRLQDPNSVYFYAYPSLAVNVNGDMLVGYARMASIQYASAAYAFRAAGDTPDTLRKEFVMEAGQGTYVKLDGNGINRWGDYSATQVDPVNDTDFWTVQEYAAAPSSSWGEWWANITAPSTSVPALQSVTVTPKSLFGGQPSKGTVTLSQAAPSGGLSIGLTSNNAAAQVPSGGSVLVPSGSTSATFNISTSAVSSTTPVTISANYNGVTLPADLTLYPPGAIIPLDVVQAQQNFNPNTGSSVTATISSTGGNLLVAYVREGSSATDNFTVSDNLGQSWTLAGYNSFNSTNRSAIFYRPNSAAVSSVTANFTTGGGVTRPGIVVYEIVGAATSSPVDAGPVANTFSASQTAITSAPLTTSNANDVLIMAVDLSASQAGTNDSFAPGTGFAFPTTGAPTDPRQAVSYEIVSSGQTKLTSSMHWGTSASQGGSQFIAFMAAGSGPPPALKSVVPSLPSVTGGQSLTGTVTLTSAAPTGGQGIVVNLASSDPSAQVPANVTVPANQSSATFTITTSPVSNATAVTISGSYNGVTMPSAPNLTVNPPTLLQPSLSLYTVVGGQSSPSSTGTVTLTGPAPSGGAVVNISSNSTFAVLSSSSVTVPANQMSATFTITTSAVSVPTQATITGNYNSGTNQTVTLTINPVGGGTPLSVVQARQNFNPNTGLTSITANITSTVGNLLVAYVREGSSATDNFTVTDNLGQSWTPTAYNSFNSTNRSAIFYRPNSAAVSSVTATFTTGGGVTRPGIVVYEIAGTTTLDAGPVANTFSASQTAITSAPLTTSNANDILIMAVDLSASQSGSNSSFVPGTGFAFPATGTATDPRQAVSYEIVSSGQTNLTSSMHWGTSAPQGGSQFVAFK